MTPPEISNWRRMAKRGEKENGWLGEKDNVEETTVEKSAGARAYLDVGDVSLLDEARAGLALFHFLPWKETAEAKAVSNALVDRLHGSRQRTLPPTSAPSYQFSDQ